MKRTIVAAMLIGGLASGTASGGPNRASAPKGPRISTVSLVISHRVFQDFVDREVVKLNQEFRVGDTEYTARIVQYVADFAMDMETRKIFSRSPEPKNPAFKIIVKRKNVPQDTSWAMLVMPPHFARKSMLAFRIDRIDFIGHDPILRPDAHPDSTAHPIQLAPGHESMLKGGKVAR